MVVETGPLEVEPETPAERAAPKTACFTLSSRELRVLRRARRDRSKPARVELAQAILLAALGKTDHDIARDLGLSVDAVQGCWRRFARCRLEALLEDEPPGFRDSLDADSLEASTTEPDDAPTYVFLRGAERRALQKVVNAHKSEQRRVLRARIVLLAAAGRNNCQIADELSCSVKTVRKWRTRFAQDRLEGLYDLPRSGRPQRFTVTQRHDVFALLLGEPPKPHARWTLDLMVDALKERGILPSIARETISNWLRTADIKPHRCKYWLNSKDPDFKEKMDRILKLYTQPPQHGRVICIDEKTCIPARERLHPDLPAKPGRPRRAEFHYKRHGIIHLLAAFEVQTGRVIGECVRGSANSETFIRFLCRLRKMYPRETLYLVLDNGSTHRSEETMKFFKKHPRLVPVFTPTHGSWLNQIEIWFSALTRQALKGASFKTLDELENRILEYIDFHNATATPYRWTKTGEPLKAA